MKRIIFAVFSVLVIFPTLLPLFNDGFFTIHDNTQVERVFQMTKSISDGQFPVRWVDDLGYGYGYPIFNFYAPLPYYIGGFFNLVLSDSLLATKIMFVLGTVLSFFTMYFFASRLTNRYGGLVAGIIYLYFPYHAINIYVRGAVGEFFAYAFTPLVFWGIYFIYDKLSNRKKIREVALSSFLIAVPVALVIISHNLSAFMMGIFLVPYIIFLLIRIKRRKEFAYSLLILFSTAFLLSAFYTLPAILESQFTNVTSQIGGGADYNDHFVCLSQLWYSQWGFGGSAPGCTDGLSFSLGRINILLTGAAFLFFLYIFLKSRKVTYEVIIWFLLLMSIFLMLPVSKFLWDTIPYMEYLQYPWRFLNFAGLFISLISALLLFKIRDKRITFSILLLVLAGQLYFNTKLFKPVEINSFSNTYYESTDHIRWETSKISDEYMPPDFLKPMTKSELPSALLSAENDRVKLTLNEARTGYIEFVKEGNDSMIHINKAYFPFWTVSVNGKKVDLIEENNGVSFFVPDRDNNIILQIKSTPIQKIANILTIIGIVLIAAVIIVKRKKKNE